MPAFQSRQVYRITLKYPEARPSAGVPSRIAQVGPQEPPAPSLRCVQKGAPLRGGSLLWTTWTIRSAEAQHGHLTTHQQIATGLQWHRQEIAERIKDAGAGLRSIAEPWADTTTPAGRMVLTVFAGIADFERSLIVERTSAGRIAAKARGIRFGPHPSLGAEQIEHARQLIQQAGKPVAEVAKLLGVHRSTLYRALDSPPPHHAEPAP